MATTLKINEFDAIHDAIHTHAAVRFAFPDGSRRQMSLRTWAGIKALQELISNIQISGSLDTAIYNTAVSCDQLRLREKTFANLVEIIDALDETAKGSAPDPEVTLTFH